jgi:squalene-hopene/tetraprenyl-beta-curcumene cyclase
MSTASIAAPTALIARPSRPAQSSRSNGELAARADAALELSVDALFAKQHADGHWCAELEGDSILNSEYLLMKVILGQHIAPAATPSDLARFGKMCVYLRRLQRTDGSWGQYPGSPLDLSATVKAYFALKLFGDDPDVDHMRRARAIILRHGGAENINTFSMFYLACLGQVSWEACPAIPPEIALLPRWFPFHLDKVAAWTRTMILPLALCTALRPVRHLSSTQGIGELFVDQSCRTRLNKPWDRADPVGWTNIFLAIDRALKMARNMGVTPGRSAAIRAAERWLLSRMTSETTDGLGAIFPPMVYIQVALQALGYAREHPVIRAAEQQLDRFIVEQPDHVRIQPCFSPVWDTGIAVYALTEAGRTSENDPRIARACAWLRDREVARVGDWINNLRREDRSLRMGPGGDAGAWAFEYRNDWYPDVDDTAMVCKALRRAGDTTPSRPNNAAAMRGVRWILAMQNDDGGWAAFDRTRDRRWMEHVPFADHNAMQDPSCADITGRTIESLVTNGLPPSHPAILAAVDYLRREQRPQGPWWGRWGCNFLYGSWQALGGLSAAGESPSSPYLRKAADWLRSVQNPDGGFGESANSYLDEALMGQGPSTASQTAWGLASLLYLVDPADPAVERAVHYLCESQLRHHQPPDPPLHPLPEPPGAWREEWFTGTGFPKVFYLRYHLYRHYFPVMSLARYLRLLGASAR